MGSIQTAERKTTCWGRSDSFGFVDEADYHFVQNRSVVKKAIPVASF
jgi:hypothetical protein